MLKHILDDHPGEKIENIKFGMRVKLRFKTALERQVSEAVEIHQAQLKGYKLMNSKSEYSRCSLPRLRIENQDELLDTLLSERNREKKLKEQIRGLKKRKKDPLIAVCEEIENTNNKKWKKRKLDELVVKRNREAEEEKELEKQNRLRRAHAKKEELLEKIKNHNTVV